MGFFDLLYMAFIALFIIYMSYALRAYLPLWGWFLKLKGLFSQFIGLFRPRNYVRQRSVGEVLFNDDDEDDGTSAPDAVTDPALPVSSIYGDAAPNATEQEPEWPIEPPRPWRALPPIPALTDADRALLTAMESLRVPSTARAISVAGNVGISGARKILRNLHSVELVKRLGDGTVKSPYLWRTASLTAKTVASELEVPSVTTDGGCETDEMVVE